MLDVEHDESLEMTEFVKGVVALQQPIKPKDFMQVKQMIGLSNKKNIVSTEKVLKALHGLTSQIGVLMNRISGSSPKTNGNGSNQQSVGLQPAIPLSNGSEKVSDVLAMETRLMKIERLVMEGLTAQYQEIEAQKKFRQEANALQAQMSQMNPVASQPVLARPRPLFAAFGCDSVEKSQMPKLAQ